MALYVPAGRRRRNLILGLVGALIVGLVIGGVLGRVTAPTLSDKVASVRDSASEVTARLQATPIEYEKQLAGSTEFQKGGTVVQSLTDAQQSLRSALDDAVWLSPRQRTTIERRLDDLLALARARVPAARYQDAVATTATFIESSLGITSGASG